VQISERRRVSSRPIKVDPSRPRVLLVTPQPFFEDRGTPIAVAFTARALAESGYEVDLLAFPIGKTVSIPGVNIERCRNPFGFQSVPVGFSLRKALLDVSLLRRFEQLLTTRRYDAVHAVEEAACMAAVLCPLHKLPFVYDMASAIPEQLSEHPILGLQPLQALARMTERRVLDRAAHVVCSGGLAGRVRDLAPHTAVTEWRYPVFETTPDHRAVATLRERQQIAVSDRVLLYIGNFARYQGIDLLLDAFAIAAAADSRLLLVCVGAADAEQALETEMRLPANLRHRVRILPRENRPLVQVWLALADCLVSLRPSGDNIPLKLFEYMAARKPIVASRGPAHQTILNDERAFLCGLDARGIADGITRVFADPARARRVADTAGDFASRNFSWSRFRQLVSGIYGNLPGTDLAHEAQRSVSASRR